MPTVALRAILAALLVSIGDIVTAQSDPSSGIAEDQRLLPYVQPGQLVNIGGRRINLHCTGDYLPLYRSASTINAKAGEACRRLG